MIEESGLETRYGVIIGQADPSTFEFNIADPETRPVNYEYVQIELEEQLPGGTRRVDVLGQVKTLFSRHPFYDQRTTPGAVWKQQELGVGEELLQIVASVKILGYIHEKGGRREVRRPRSPPLPGTPVHRASDELLRQLFSVEEESLPLSVGHLLHRGGIPVPVSGRELHRHTAVLAMTRYGKSYFAGRVIEELLRQGATVLVIDAHGDYANMTQDPEGRLHDYFQDKVTVYRPEAAETFEAPHAVPLRLSVSGCSFQELRALARVTGSLQTILLRRAIRRAASENPVYTLEDIIDKLEEMMGTEKAEGQDRIARIIMRLEDLIRRGIFTEGDVDVRRFFRPQHMSDVFLSGMTDYVQDVVVGMLLRRIWDSKFRKEPWARLPVFIFVEEAHRFAAPPEEGGGKFSRDILARIAAEGAKFGVFLTVISQRPRRLDPDILANCSNLAILRVVNSQDQRTIQAASESFSEDLLADLPALEQGEAVLVGPFVPIPVMVRTSTRETRHGGRTPNIYGLLREARDRAEAEKEREGFRLH
ncbi:MAG: ATP-binding protein [Candidatus Bathyarchaeota archaeon]|nr:MAG: ATP-binding protein [Candidatus Bathyarchaeota archaeon]